MDSYRQRTIELERLELGIRRVVDDDGAAIVACASGAEDCFEVAAAGPAFEASRDDDRVLVGGHPEPLELVDDGGDRLLSRVEGGARPGQATRLDDDHGATAARDEIAEWRA